ncbi:MAG: hypothetical protein WC155_02825 [Candidatus Cloacimonadales bacterium]
MLYLLAIINLVLTGFCGLAFYNIYKPLRAQELFLEIAVMAIAIILLIVTNIGILWVNNQRGKVISELEKKNTMLEQELTAQKRKNEEKNKEVSA